MIDIINISKTVQVFALGINWGVEKVEDKIYNRISLILGFVIVSFYFNKKNK